MKLSAKMLRAYNEKNDVLFDKIMSAVDALEEAVHEANRKANAAQTLNTNQRVIIDEFTFALKAVVGKFSPIIETVAGFGCRFCNCKPVSYRPDLRHTASCAWLIIERTVADG